MPSLAQRLRDEGKEYWYNHWRKEELEKGLKKNTEEVSEKVAEDIARSLLLEGLDIDMISKVTKLPKEIIERLHQTTH